VTPDCVPPVPEPRVSVSGSVCPPPLATVTLANDGDPASTVVYGVRVDGELVQESAPIYGGGETTIVADLSAYEDQTVTVALVANGRVLGRRTLSIDCEQPPGPGPDTDTAPGSDTAPGEAGSTPVPTVIPSGAPPEPDPSPLGAAVLVGTGILALSGAALRGRRVR